MSKTKYITVHLTHATFGLHTCRHSSKVCVNIASRRRRSSLLFRRFLPPTCRILRLVGNIYAPAVDQFLHPLCDDRCIEFELIGV